MVKVKDIDIDGLNEAARLLEGLRDMLILLQSPANGKIAPVSVIFLIETVVSQTLDMLEAALAQHGGTS